MRNILILIFITYWINSVAVAEEKEQVVYLFCDHHKSQGYNPNDNQVIDYNRQEFYLTIDLALHTVVNTFETFEKVQLISKFNVVDNSISWISSGNKNYMQKVNMNDGQYWGSLVDAQDYTPGTYSILRASCKKVKSIPINAKKNHVSRNPDAESAMMGAALSAWREKNYEQAIKLLQPLGEAGSMIAQYYLGRLYSEVPGVTQNYKLAAYWFGKAAAQGSMDAKQELDKLNINGVTH